MINKLINLFRNSGDHFEGQEPGEEVILLLRQHSFTIMYPIGFIFLFALAPLVVRATLPVGTAAFYFITSLYYMWLWVVLFYRLTLYALNTVIVTDRRIINNEQQGFFKRKVSELHSYRVQDISVHVHGLLPTVFDFGDIVVQTASAEREFSFSKIGDPERVKDKIMQVVDAHQTKVGLS
jgi:hypothetical protein